MIAIPFFVGAMGAGKASTTMASVSVDPVAATPVQEVPAPVRDPNLIEDGVYAVGTEFKPGVYRVGRYWELQDAQQGILDNDMTSGCPTLVVVRPVHAYIKIDGGAIDASLTTVDPIAKRCTSGTFLVGADIQPGRYRLNPTGDMGYWERINANLGTIDNDLGGGQRIVVVRKTDFALKINNAILEAMN